MEDSTEHGGVPPSGSHEVLVWERGGDTAAHQQGELLLEAVI